MTKTTTTETAWTDLSQSEWDTLPKALQASLPALLREREALREALADCLRFWNEPPRGFGCNEQRKADLDNVKANATKALNWANQQP